MIGHRILTSSKIERGLHPKNFNFKWVFFQSCRDVREWRRFSEKESPFLWVPTEEAYRKSCIRQNTIYLSLPIKEDHKSKSHESCEKIDPVNESRKYLCLDPFESINSTNGKSNLTAKNSFVTAMDELSIDPKNFRVESKNNAYSNPTVHSSKASILLGENRYKKNKQAIDKLSKNAQYFFKSHKPRMSKTKKTKKLPGTEEFILEKVVDDLMAKWPHYFESKGSLGVKYISESIIFDNAVLGIKTKGLQWYKIQLQCFKWATKFVWSEPDLQILSISKHPEDSTIKVRWLTNGKPRILYPLILVGRAPSSRYMDFFSILKVGQNGEIEAHRLTKLVPRQSAQKRNPLISLLTLFGLAGRDIPELQEKPILPSSTESGG